MKILIIDDTPQRYARLTPLLSTIGIDRSSLDFVICANDARTRLSEDHFDLVIMDILIPLWADSDADAQHSADLLTELVDGDELNRPRHIVGISANKLAATQATPAFSRHLWTVINYSESDDEWLTQLVNCVEYIRDAKVKALKPDHHIDVAIICALSEPELSAVLELPWAFQPARPIDDLTFIHEGSFQCSGKKYTVCALAAPRMGMVSASLTTLRVIERMRPKLIVMAGICAGIKGKSALGDVVFADPCWDWQSGKYLREADQSAAFAIAPHQLGPSAAARAHIEQIRSDKHALASISVEGPDEAPGVLKVVIGPVASGSAVIADDEIVAEIKQQNREVCAVEMECYGVFAAASNSSNPQPQVFALKAVCDFADPHKNDKVQRYAAYSSARVTQLMLERYFDRLI